MKNLFFLTTFLLCALLANGQMRVPETYLQKANACFDKGDYECAKLNYNLWQGMDGSDMSAQIKKADECYKTIIAADDYFKNKKYSDARVRYKTVLDKNPKDPYAKKQYNLCGEQLSSTDIAIADLQEHKVVVEESVKPQIFSHVEVMPQFPGGDAALMKWLSENINYPTIAQEQGIQGRVNLRFVVKPDGSVDDVQVIKGLDPSCDKEAVNKVKMMPKWVPGKQNGNPVYVYYQLPVTFRLQNGFFDDYTETINNLNLQMVAVQGGTFTMGCTSEQGSDCEDDEKPAHQVTVSSFYIGKYQVTQAQWRAVMGNNPSAFKGDNLPVERVSWDDVQEFIRKLNAQTGKQYRLPTEAEWEFTARGGIKSQGYKYSGSNNLYDVAWYADNCGGTTHPVGTKSSNELGIYDMSGNVCEWCNDWEGRYSSTAQTNPQGASSGSYRVYRGGDYFRDAQRARVSGRVFNISNFVAPFVGFRLACSSK